MGKCAICGKGPSVGYKISHSHIRTKRTWSPNLQRARVIINGVPRRIMVCTKCLKSIRAKAVG